MKVLSLILCIVAVSAVAGESLYVPHLAADQGSFSNQLVFHNRTDKLVDVRLVTYDQDDIEAEFTVTLGAGERLVAPPNDVWGRRSVTHYKIDRREGLSAGVQILSASNPDYMAFLPAIENPSTQWRVHASDWTKAYDGVAIVNASCFNAELQLILHAEDGKQLKIIDPVLPLSGNQKTLYDLSALFSEDAEGAYVDIVSDQPLVVLGLNGSRDAGLDTSYLVGNVAVPISAREDIRAALISNRAKWIATGFSDSYRFTLQTGCLCDRELEVEVVVRNHRLTSMVRADDQSELTLGETRDYYTVAELFNLIETYLDSADDIKVAFHPDEGYPTDIRVDELLCVTDDEIHWSVKNLEGIR
ncbi:MAG: DUF6174 domain-containing protein [Acidobacteriota bacterium]|nr:DUF6174 domain-containing protein [Acidobacteriota bacterium]